MDAHRNSPSDSQSTNPHQERASAILTYANAILQVPWTLVIFEVAGRVAGLFVRPAVRDANLKPKTGADQSLGYKPTRSFPKQDDPRVCLGAADVASG